MKNNTNKVEEFVSIDDWEQHYLPDRAVMKSADFDVDHPRDDWEEGDLNLISHSPVETLPADKKREKMRATA